MDDTARTPGATPQATATPVGNRPMILFAAMLTMFTIGISSTVVATAMPTIVGELGGFELFSWVFAIYLLTQAASVPIYGKLADIYGRKPMYFIGATLYLIGLLLGGFADSMGELVVWRALQGLGSGAVYPIATVIVGDIYSPVERAKIQGNLSMMWGISSVVGPAVGAFIVSHWSWPMVFWINIPLGLAPMVILAVFHRENVPRRRHSIDFAGSFLLMTGTVALMMALIQGSRLPLPVLAGLVALAVGCLLLFIRQERRAAEPMMPLGLWRMPLIAAGNMGAFAVGVVLMGVLSYQPAYVQGVMARGPEAAALALGALSLAWPVASTIGGRLMVRTSYRTTARAGAACLMAGTAWLVVAEGLAEVVGASFVVGLGIGFSLIVYVVSAQASVDWSQRGIATSLNLFMRSVGMSVGAAIAGATVNAMVGARTAENHDVAAQLMDPASRAALDPATIARFTELLSSGINWVFVMCAGFAVIVAIISQRVPAHARPGQH